MAEGFQDNENVTPSWMEELEKRLQSRQLKLGHEIGAGAKCFNCRKCQGLELHYWRKQCKKCKCAQALHDIQEDQNLRFNILFAGKENCIKYKEVLRLKRKDVIVDEIGDSCVKGMLFDWVPGGTSRSLAVDYMHQLPTDKIPISGTEGAQYRKIQLNKQIPIHDLIEEERKSELEKEEKPKYYSYLAKLKEDAGIGKILRLKQMQFMEESEACERMSPQHSRDLKPLSPDVGDQSWVHVTKFNINLLPPGAGCETIRPVMSQYAQCTPRSTMRSLPRIIPHSILRLPSSFFPNEMESNMIPMVNNNMDSKSDDLSGIAPLPLTPPREMKSDMNQNMSQPLKTPGSSTPVNDIESADSFISPSKYAERIGSLDNFPSPIKDRSSQDESFLSSDSTNANLDDSSLSLPESLSEVHFVEKNMSCQHCQLDIEMEKVAVLIEKGDSRMAWHPECFVCSECKELLVDLMYFFHDGKVFCARDYSKIMRVHRCSACDELLFVNEFTMAEDRYFHLHHFCCADCDEPLADKQYVLNENNNNLPTCLPCFLEIYAERCNSCGLPIPPNERFVNYKDIYWHPNSVCFKCSNSGCQKSLLKRKFLMCNRMPFCSNECRFKCLTLVQ